MRARKGRLRALQVGFTEADVDTVMGMGGHFRMAMKAGGWVANASTPGNGRRLLLLLALPWAWGGALPSAEASGEGQGPLQAAERL